MYLSTPVPEGLSVCTGSTTNGVGRSLRSRPVYTHAGTHGGYHVPNTVASRRL